MGRGEVVQESGRIGGVARRHDDVDDATRALEGLLKGEVPAAVVADDRGEVVAVAAQEAAAAEDAVGVPRVEPHEPRRQNAHQGWPRATGSFIH